jgi:mannosyltransferase OCH1-like enzyme
LTDEDCRLAINATKPELLFYFNEERNGSYKADICRVAALYLKGGFYFDVDMEVVQAFLPDSNATFVTVYNPKRMAFFQSFLATEPGNRILREAFDVMLDYYRQNKVDSVSLRLGPASLFAALNAVPLSERGQTHLLQEVSLSDSNTYPDIPRRIP